MDRLRYIEDTITQLTDQLSSFEGRGSASRDYIARQDLAYDRALLQDIVKDYRRLQQEITKLTSKLYQTEVEDDQLEEQRQQVEDEISQHLFQLLEANHPSAARAYRRLQRLMQYGLSEGERTEFEEIEDTHLDTFSHLPDVDSETIVSYRLPNGVTIWFDLMETLNRGAYNPRKETATAFVTIEGRIYSLPMRPEFLDQLRELYQESDLAVKVEQEEERDIIRLEMLEEQAEELLSRGLDIARQARRNTQ